MRILAVETSCDETGIAVVETSGGIKTPGFSVLANITASQATLHAKYGGVFPMMAKREHAKNLTPILEQALKESGLYKKASGQKLPEAKLKKLLEREPELFANLSKFLPGTKKPKIDAIAVTSGPGLEPTLWVGINFAKALSLAWDIPVVPVNHMEGHIFSAFINESEFSVGKIKFPALALLVSGGHTELVLAKDWLKYKIIGETRDDAAGEAFDKVARLLDLPYPGGPEISRLAKTGRENPEIKLPRPMLHSGDFNFSFSGLKTAVLYLVKKMGKLSDKTKADLALEFEKAVAEVLVAKTLSAMRKYGAKTLILGGGVAANDRLREGLKKILAEKFPDCALHLPAKNLTGDNALMIAVAGYFRATSGQTKKPSLIKADGRLSL